MPGYQDPNRLFPVSRLMERFNEPRSAGRTTSACGPGIYRDNWLGDGYYGNAFTCEAVHNLVRRHLLEPSGATFTGRKAPDEQEREFFASRDNWSRFVQARTGPDGALWLVDMYRFVIEHPTWIPEETQKRLDLRAGADKGRIYRLKVRGKPLRPVPDLTEMPAPELAGHLDSPNGTERDRVHIEFLSRKDRAAAVPRLGRETDHRTLPHEVGWIGPGVHLAKGCYRGQEAVARVHNLGHPPRRLVLLHLDGSEETLPAHGDDVVSDGRVFGWVATPAWHHELGPIATAVIKRSTPVDVPLVVSTAGLELPATQQVVVAP